ncbi:MAG: DNA-binding protein WhiA [Candidatus Dormibacteria bacterium]
MRGWSFTDRVVAELAPHVPPLGHCRAALLEGMTLAAAGDGVTTTRAVAIRCAVAALHADGRPGRSALQRRPRHVFHHLDLGPGGPAPMPASCCSRSRLRGALLAGGSVNRPEGAASVELRARDAAAADLLLADLAVFEIPARARRRRGHTVVAVRSVEAVGAFLSCIGASAGRLAFEEGRVLREVRGSVNRTLNAETANLRRVVDAAVAQLGASERLRADPARWEALPPAVKEAALLRERRPDSSLANLAATAGISRAAMAGRLHRLVAAAQA